MPILIKNKKIPIDDVSENYEGPIKRFRDRIVDTVKDEEYIKLTELVDNSRIIFKTRTVFPFDFFPDELIIDKDKIAIISKFFIASDRHKSILIKNISDVYVDTSIFFSTIYIYDKYFANDPTKVDYLWKKEAIRARDIIQGLVICCENDVDTSGMKQNELLPYLEEIGKAAAH